nr:reverse transcriptase domain-containing protein [Tanacetum cinerariifolium]
MLQSVDPTTQGVSDALAEYEANRSSRNGDESHDSRSGRRRTEHTTRECTYSDFLKCQPLNFKGTEGVLGLTQCEIKKLEIKIWNLKVKGTDVVSYSQRFQELALMCGRMFLEESDQVEKYVGGVPDMIQSSVMASKPKIMQEAIKIANDLMDQKVRAMLRDKLGTKGNLITTTKINNNLPISKMWQGLILLGLVRRRSMLGVYRCAKSASFTTLARALSDCSKLKNWNHGNQAGGTESRGRVYALGGGETNQDLDKIEYDINA